MFAIEEWLPFLLSKAHQQAHAIMRSALEEYKVTPPQFVALAFLWRRDAINQQELGNLMNVDRTTIGGIVLRLERLEFVQRGPDLRDRRSWVIFVTKKGNAFKEKILPILQGVSNEFSRILTAEEQKTLIMLLNKIRLD